MKKYLLTILLVSILVLTGCVRYENGEPVEESNNVNASEEASTEEEIEEPTEEETTEETAEEQTEEETEEPTEEQTEEEPAKEDEDIEHEVIEGVDVFTFTDESVISFNNQLNNFSIKMTETLSERHEEIENGAVFRTISTVTDNSGNEKTIYSAQTYYTQETIDRINFENWPQLDGEDLYNTADSVMIYHPLSGDAGVENKTYDNVPEFYMYTIGGDYEE